jgi:hypothetical protein
VPGQEVEPRVVEPGVQSVVVAVDRWVGCRGN